MMSPSLMTGVLIRGEDRDMDAYSHTEEHHVMMEAEISYAASNQEMPRIDLPTPSGDQSGMLVPTHFRLPC